MEWTVARKKVHNEANEKKQTIDCKIKKKKKKKPEVDA